MRSVVKHSYIKGTKSKSRAKAHVNYIAHRSGPDKERGTRPFFDRKRNDISSKEVKQDIDRIDQAQAVVHKMILSPGMPSVDIRDYTREVLRAVGRYKGLDLDWRGVVHTNTANDHAHVVIFGKDLNGIRVRFGRDDYRLMKIAGDRYLERVHNLERFLNSPGQLRTVLERFDPELEGDPLYRSLILRMREREEDDERKRRDEEARDISEHRLLDDLLGQTYRHTDERLRNKGKKQRMYEGRGRLLDAHLDYQDAMERKRLDDLAKANPELRDQVEQQLSELKEDSRTRLSDATGWREFDALVGDSPPVEREDQQHTIEEERHFQDQHIRQEFFENRNRDEDRDDWEDRDDRFSDFTR